MRPLPAADICRAVGGTFLQTGGGTFFAEHFDGK